MERQNSLIFYSIHSWIDEFNTAFCEAFRMLSNELEPPDKEYYKAVETIKSAWDSMGRYIPTQIGGCIDSYISALRFCLDGIECIVCQLSKEDKIAFIDGVINRSSSLFRNYNHFEIGKEYIRNPKIDSDIVILLKYLGGMALYYAISMGEMCARYNIHILAIHGADIKGALSDKYRECLRNTTILNYETMPSTHRRAAVMALIDKSGLCKNIDRTKKAAFVEAVTGGNINANPKDSVSYKKPEQKAIDAASELLKTIGIE